MTGFKPFGSSVYFENNLHESRTIKFSNTLGTRAVGTGNIPFIGVNLGRSSASFRSYRNSLEQRYIVRVPITSPGEAVWNFSGQFGDTQYAYLGEQVLAVYIPSALPPPAKPLNLRVTARTETTITIAWDKPNSEGGSQALAAMPYRVAYREAGSTGAFTEADTDPVSYTHLTLPTIYSV